MCGWSEHPTRTQRETKEKMGKGEMRQVRRRRRRGGDDDGDDDDGDVGAQVCGWGITLRQLFLSLSSSAYSSLSAVLSSSLSAVLSAFASSPRRSRYVMSVNRAY